MCMELEVNKFYFPKPFLKTNATYLQMLIATKNEKVMSKSILLQFFFDVQLCYCKYVPTIEEIKAYCEDSGLYYWSFENINNVNIK